MHKAIAIGLLIALGLGLTGCVGIGGKCDSKTPSWERGITCW